MAATIFSVPVGYDEPSFDIAVEDGADAYFKACDRHTERLAEWCRDQDVTGSEIIGETIRFHIADGYAVYMVADTKPLALIHLAYGDGYAIDDITRRGLRLSDVKALVKREHSLRELFGSKND